jgi:8-oxo-dGTP diphosphatase
MKQIAQVFLFDRRNRLIIYLRDDKPDIPFPNHWDLIGGHLEAGETPEQALVREVKEEIGIDLEQFQSFCRFDCAVGDVYPNVKHLYWARLDIDAETLVLCEGQRLISIAPQERVAFKFANVLGALLEDFIAAQLWPRPVDNF